MRKAKRAVDYMEEAHELAKEARRLVREYEYLFDNEDDVKLVWDLEKVERKIAENWSTGDKALAQRIRREAKVVYERIRGHIDYYTSQSW